MSNPISVVRRKFENIPVSEEWSFNNVRSVEQWTHGYHRYPAKFLPNLVKKLIEEYTVKNDVIADMFAGCGTSLVESKVHGRKSIGVDINPVAQLITKAKTNPIDPTILNKRVLALNKKISKYKKEEYSSIAVHKKIDYWFSPSHKFKIAFLYDCILCFRDENVRTFFLVALSNILKNCSMWLQSSTKPQIDPNKKPSDPFRSFDIQVKRMIKKNEEYYTELKKNGYLKTSCEIMLQDARKTTIKSGSISAIITSPPYVTSYEYADIHQLTGFWFDYITDLSEFRRKFIGTFYSLSQETYTSSFIGQEIVNKLNKKDKRTAKEVTNYFNDMNSVAKEMHRILKPGGHACLVIGNTTFLDVRIKSAEVFAEILMNLGFEVVEIIKRSIPYKLIPAIRDKSNGRFTTLESKNSKLCYPEEYILIAKK
jgi:DNA modification methylase